MLKRKTSKEIIQGPPMTLGQAVIANGLFGWSYGSSFGFDESAMDLKDFEIKRLAPASEEYTLVAHGVSKENAGFAAWLMLLVARLVGAAKPMRDKGIPEKVKRELAEMYLITKQDLSANPYAVAYTLWLVTRSKDSKISDLIYEMAEVVSDDQPMDWKKFAERLDAVHDSSKS